MKAEFGLRRFESGDRSCRTTEVKQATAARRDILVVAALFERVGELDGIVCTGGAARYKPWDQLTDEDWTFSLANKLMGQVHVVRYGVKTVRSGGAITLTTGLAAQFPSPGSAIITTINAAVEAFVRAAAAEPSLAVRVNAVSPGWVFGDIAGDGPQSVGWNSGRRGSQGYRPAAPRGSDGLRCAGGQGLKSTMPARRRSDRNAAPLSRS